jgi:hypothetical protein
MQRPAQPIGSTATKAAKVAYADMWPILFKLNNGLVWPPVTRNHFGSHETGTISK